MQGKFQAHLRNNGASTVQDVYVVAGLKQPLLGWPAIRQLSILKYLSNVTSAAKFANLFPRLFNGLGKISGDYTIKLKPDVSPFCLSSPRRVPVPLQDSVVAELKRMKKEGVISPVTEPTDWCGPMVVAPKKNNAVRICVDFTHLD